MSPQTRTGLIAFGVVGGLFLACSGLAGVLLLVNRDRATESDRGKIVGLGDGEAARRGKKPVEGPGWFGPSASSEGATWTLPELAKYLEEKGAVKPDRVAYATPLGMPLAEFVMDGDVVLNVLHCDSPQKAKDVAAARGKEAYFGWGRFAISGRKATVEAARKALGA